MDRPLHALTVLFALVSACGEAAAPSEPPLIRLFTVEGIGRAKVEAGRSAVLAWQVSGADRLRIDAEPGGLLVPDAPPSGTFRTEALQVTTRFLLTARGPGGEASKVVTAEVLANDQVGVVSFRAVPSQILPGESTSLSWEVERAEQVRIDAVGGEVLLAGDPRQTGTLNLIPPVTRTYLLTASGRGGPAVAAVTVMVLGSPRIIAFRAEPPRVTRGESVRLVYRVENVDRVMILDQAGAVQLSSTDEAGELEVQPQRDERYTLTVARAGFPEVRAELTVEVAQPPGARWVAAGVSPSSVPYGDPVEVELEAENAPDGIWARFRDEEVFRAAGPEVNFTFTPTVSGTLEVEAANRAEGNATLRFEIEVRPEAPRILSFEVYPSLAILGRVYHALFEVRGADSLELRSDAGVQSLDPSVTREVALVATSTSTRLRLEASNRFGIASQELDAVATDQPVIDAFWVEPELFDGASVTATLSYAVRNATRLELSGPAGASAGFPSPFVAVGSWQLLLEGSGMIRLLATNPSGAVRLSRAVAQLGPELEPNDDLDAAQPLAGDGGGVRARLDGPADSDFYRLYAPEGASMTALLGRRALGCEDQLRLELSLLGPDGTEELAFAAEDHEEACLSIRPSTHPGALDLPDGELWLRVQGPDAVEYVLTASVAQR